MIISDKIKDFFYYPNSHQSICLIGEQGTGKFLSIINQVKLYCDNLDVNYINNQDIMIIKNNNQKILVEDIKKVQEFAILKPVCMPKKIIIIQDIERMNKNAANAILKTLEEPSSKALFLLSCSNSAKTIPTILSRCVKIKTGKPSSEQVRKDLIAMLKEENIEANQELIDNAIIISENRIQFAFQYIKFNLEEFYKEILRDCLMSKSNFINTLKKLDSSEINIMETFEFLFRRICKQLTMMSGGFSFSKTSFEAIFCNKILQTYFYTPEELYNYTSKSLRKIKNSKTFNYDPSSIILHTIMGLKLIMQNAK